MASGPRTDCPDCGAPLAVDQRYCVGCGARRGPLPAHALHVLGPAAVGSAGSVPRESPSAGRAPLFAMPSPRAAAVAVLSVLAFGVIIGTVVSPAENSEASAPLVVALEPAATPQAAAPVSEPAPAPAAATPAPPATPAPAPAQTTTIVEQPPAATQPTVPISAGPQLPAIKHVFLIVLSDHGFDAAFGADSQAPYLAKTLAGQGELIPNYYGVTHGALANEIALISGQGPTPQTADDCPQYADIAAGDIKDGQATGTGCVYPAKVLTLPDELVGNGNTWKAYVEGVGAAQPAGAPATCRHPDSGADDPYRLPRPGDAYVTWRNPFVYFHSLLDQGACTSSDVGLDQLAPDLKTEPTTPSVSYIVPDRCHDGSEQPCAPGQPAGLGATDAWLQTLVPEIEASDAYRAGGLIAITFDEAPQTGADADLTGCCVEPVYPNLDPAAPPSPTPGSEDPAAPADTTTTAAPPPGTDTSGGGKVGLLLISQFVAPGTVNQASTFNHYSLLRSIEDLFNLQPTGYAADPSLLPFDSVVYNAPAKTGR